jgi:hypothetical protein
MENVKEINLNSELNRLKLELDRNEITLVAYNLKKSVQTIKNYFSGFSTDVVMIKAIIEEGNNIILNRSK